MLGERMEPQALLGEHLGWDAPRGAVHTPVHLLAGPFAGIAKLAEAAVGR
jgi:hypothetical protein